MIAAIVNPKSANGRTGKEWSAIQSTLESELGKIKICMTETHLHAVDLTRYALKSGADLVLAIGGDGTTNEVINGFFEHGQSIRTSAALAVISRGTGGDFVRSFHFPKNLTEIAQFIKNTPPKPCDVVRTSLEPGDGERRERFFINIADLGIGGMVADTVNKTTKALGGKMSFLLAGISTCT